MTTSLVMESFEEQKTKMWPKTGRHILAQFNKEIVIVYQAFTPDIAKFAVEHGQFGGPKYNVERMTWIKTNFLWMMYRAGWATKYNQERILAIHLSKEGFNDILRAAKEGKGVKDRHEPEHGRPDDVRLQWDPDHGPRGAPVTRRAIQLGLRGNVLKLFHSEYIKRIEDITDFVIKQREIVEKGNLEDLLIPREREYVPEDEELCRHIRLDGFHETEEKNSTDKLTEHGQSDSAVGACCSEMLVETGNQKEDIVLCLGGAFNPVHTRHVQVMVEAKTWLEENTNYNVVAGRFAVAPDGYVKGKCRKTNERCIKAEHRIKLCDVVCEEYGWLKAHVKSIGSAGECGKKVRREMGSYVEVAVIVGADRAMDMSGRAKWRKDYKHITVCMGREGETRPVIEAFEKDCQDGRVSKSGFYIIPQELDNVSSTEVRKKLTVVDQESDNERKEKAMGLIVQLGWINEKQATYILNNTPDMYLS